MTNTLLPPDAGRTVQLGALGVRFILGTDQTGGGFAALAALQAHYGLEMDMSSVERLTREHGLAEMG
jgi:hypothetical protein